MLYEVITLLDPAPSPEGHRRGAEPLRRSRDAQGHGRAGRGAGARRELRVRRHGGIRGLRRDLV